MYLDPIKDFLKNGGKGTEGVDLFVNTMPYKVKTGTLLKSPLRGTDIDHELPGYYKGEFAIICRSPNYTDGLALIRDIVSFLTLSEQQLPGGMYVNYMRAKTLPINFPISDGDLIEFTVTMDVCYVV